MSRRCVAVVVCGVVLWSAGLACAQAADERSGATDPGPVPAVEAPPVPPVQPGPAWDDRPFTRLFPNLLSDVRRLPSIGSGVALGLGGAVALMARPNDDHLSAHASAGGTDQVFAAGAWLGTAVPQVGGAVATYVLGRLVHRETMTHVGADLIRAQMLTGLLTHGIKLGVRRTRPVGESGSYSFPSGHASASFATATVLWRHFGWKTGVPATLVAAYIGGARMQEKQHYLSDIAFGAALGIAGGRTVTMGHRGPRLLVAPSVVPGGAGLNMVVLPR